MTVEITEKEFQKAIENDITLQSLIRKHSDNLTKEVAQSIIKFAVNCFNSKEPVIKKFNSLKLIKELSNKTSMVNSIVNSKDLLGRMGEYARVDKDVQNPDNRGKLMFGKKEDPGMSF